MSKCVCVCVRVSSCVFSEAGAFCMCAFVPRRDELKRLLAELVELSAASRVGLMGPSGMGLGLWGGGPLFLFPPSPAPFPLSRGALGARLPYGPVSILAPTYSWPCIELLITGHIRPCGYGSLTPNPRPPCHDIFAFNGTKKFRPSRVNLI